MGEDRPFGRGWDTALGWPTSPGFPGTRRLPGCGRSVRYSGKTQTDWDNLVILNLKFVEVMEDLPHGREGLDELTGNMMAE